MLQIIYKMKDDEWKKKGINEERNDFSFLSFFNNILSKSKVFLGIGWNEPSKRSRKHVSECHCVDMEFVPQMVGKQCGCMELNTMGDCSSRSRYRGQFSAQLANVIEGRVIVWVELSCPADHHLKMG